MNIITCAPSKPDPSTIYHVDSTLIEVEEGFNPRFDFSDVADFSESIDINGVRRALEVYKKGDKIILKNQKTEHL